MLCVSMTVVVVACCLLLLFYVSLSGVNKIHSFTEAPQQEPKLPKRSEIGKMALKKGE